MRKFKRTEDSGPNGFDGLSDDQLAGLNSPRMSRRNRGGSFSGQAVQDSSGSGFDSPSVRRRRSRIPSEEDDKLVIVAIIVTIDVIVTIAVIVTIDIATVTVIVTVAVSVTVAVIATLDVTDSTLEFDQSN